MSSLKPIKLWGHMGPNPMKVMIIFNELKVPYEVTQIGFDKVKGPEYTAVNPNGRLPSIHDPNTDLTLWESGAIIEYLIDTYDKENRLSFASTSQDYYLAKQWLHFQATGQGPYFGQFVWFTRFHSEQLPSALERYKKEINRVSSVLDAQLEKRDWLVGDKMSYVDLSFIPWHYIVNKMGAVEDHPNLKKWMDRMGELDSVKKMFADTA